MKITAANSIEIYDMFKEGKIKIGTRVKTYDTTDFVAIETITNLLEDRMFWFTFKGSKEEVYSNMITEIEDEQSQKEEKPVKVVDDVTQLPARFKNRNRGEITTGNDNMINPKVLDFLNKRKQRDTVVDQCIKLLQNHSETAEKEIILNNLAEVTNLLLSKIESLL